jgi:cobalt-zinc-cadmium efflux system outer membrane protein
VLLLVGNRNILMAGSQGDSTSGVTRLTVKLATDLALQHNPYLRQLAGIVDAREGEVWTSFGLPSPELSYLNEGTPVGGSGYVERRWTIRQHVDFPLKTYYRLERVSAQGRSARQRYQAETLRIRADVKRAYTDVLYALGSHRLRSEALDLARQLRDAVTARSAVGEASDLELLKAEIQFAEASNQMADVDRSLHRARYTLFNTIGLDPAEQKYSIQFSDTLRYFEITLNEDTVLQTLLQQDDYLSITSALDAADHGVGEAWSDLLPDFFVSYYRQDYGIGFDNYGFEVGIKVPLWFFFQQRGGVQMAQAARSQVSWEQRAVALSLKRQAELAWHGFTSSQEIIRRHAEIINSRSRHLNTLALEAYRVGELELIALLDAQRTFVESQLHYLEALRDYYYQLIEIERFLKADFVFVSSGESRQP